MKTMTRWHIMASTSLAIALSACATDETEVEDSDAPVVDCDIDPTHEECIEEASLDVLTHPFANHVSADGQRVLVTDNMYLPGRVAVYHVDGRYDEKPPVDGYGNWAMSMSDDGSVIIGSVGESETQEMAALFGDDGSWTPLGSFGACSGKSYGWGVSGDGSTLVGMSWLDDCKWVPVKWTEDGGLEELATFGDRRGRATSTNADGSVIAGWAFQEGAFFGRSPVLWRSAEKGGDILLAPNTDGEVVAVSPDGDVAVGKLDGQAAVWRDGGAFEQVGLAGKETERRFDFSNTLNDICSDDGTLAVGIEQYYLDWDMRYEFEAIVYSEEYGVRYLVDILDGLGVEYPEGSHFVELNGCSDSGQTISGTLVEAGELQGFVLRTPPGFWHQHVEIPDRPDEIPGDTGDTGDGGFPPISPH